VRNVIISLFCLASIYILWPYIAVFSLYVALQTGDIAGVEERVDWSSLKKELRMDLNNLIKIRLKKSLNKKMQLNFDSLNLSEQISDKIATPEGLIYLFNEPNEFIEQIRQIFTNTLPLEKINPPAAEKKSFQLEGPNFPNLFEHIKYAFFTEPYSFRLSFNEAKLSFNMDWRLQGFFWKLVRLKVPIKKI
tara:strand:- start:838 stop:1410 length:573 start_codon:yes stop_codon:yes gene_type:complete